ncbi:MAG: hypothetical protein V1859_00685 [archaeon]
MNNHLRSIILTMLNKHIIGGKHIPENIIIKSKTKWMNSSERNIFQKEFDDLIKQEFFIRLKKRSGKGSDWHISLNPGRLNELKLIMSNGE